MFTGIVQGWEEMTVEDKKGTCILVGLGVFYIAIGIAFVLFLKGQPDWLIGAVAFAGTIGGWACLGTSMLIRQ